MVSCEFHNLLQIYNSLITWAQLDIAACTESRVLKSTWLSLQVLEKPMCAVWSPALLIVGGDVTSIFWNHWSKKQCTAASFWKVAHRGEKFSLTLLLGGSNTWEHFFFPFEYMQHCRREQPCSSNEQTLNYWVSTVYYMIMSYNLSRHVTCLPMKELV